jgi:hypothetical protein
MPLVEVKDLSRSWRRRSDAIQFAAESESLRGEEITNG